MDLDDAADDLVIHLLVAMNDAMPRRLDLSPRDLRVRDGEVAILPLDGDELLTHLAMAAVRRAAIVLDRDRVSASVPGALCFQ